MAQQADTERLLQEGGCHPAQRHPGSRLPGAGTLQHWPGLFEVELLHSHEVSVTRARSGQGGAAGLALEVRGRDRIGRHHDLPLRPLSVCHLNSDRAALGLAVPDPPKDRDSVGLELHPRATPVPQPAPSQRIADLAAGDEHMSRQPFEDRHQRGTVRLAGGQPSEHDQQSSTCTDLSASTVVRTTTHADDSAGRAA